MLPTIVNNRHARTGLSAPPRSQTGWGDSSYQIRFAAHASMFLHPTFYAYSCPVVLITPRTWEPNAQKYYVDAPHFAMLDIVDKYSKTKKSGYCRSMVKVLFWCVRASRAHCSPLATMCLACRLGIVGALVGLGYFFFEGKEGGGGLLCLLLIV